MEQNKELDECPSRDSDYSFSYQRLQVFKEIYRRVVRWYGTGEGLSNCLRQLFVSREAKSGEVKREEIQLNGGHEESRVGPETVLTTGYGSRENWGTSSMGGGERAAGMESRMGWVKDIAGPHGVGSIVDPIEEFRWRRWVSFVNHLT